GEVVGGGEGVRAVFVQQARGEVFGTAHPRRLGRQVPVPQGAVGEQGRVGDGDTVVGAGEGEGEAVVGRDDGEVEGLGGDGEAVGSEAEGAAAVGVEVGAVAQGAGGLLAGGAQLAVEFLGADPV